MQAWTLRASGSVPGGRPVKPSIAVAAAFVAVVTMLPASPAIAQGRAVPRPAPAVHGVAVARPAPYYSAYRPYPYYRPYGYYGAPYYPGAPYYGSFFVGFGFGYPYYPYYPS